MKTIIEEIHSVIVFVMIWRKLFFSICQSKNEIDSSVCPNSSGGLSSRRRFVKTLYHFVNRRFFERLRHILKHFSNIEIIEISGDVTEDNKDVKRLFDLFHELCNNWTKFIFDIQYITEELIQRFFEKLGSNIIELIISKPILKIMASNKESNVEKMFVCFDDFDLSLNEIQFKRLKYFHFTTFNIQVLDPLEVFIKRNAKNIKHLDLYILKNHENPSDEQKARILNIISNLSNLVELILNTTLHFNDKQIDKNLTQIANNCKELKSIEISFIMTSKNCEDLKQVMATLKQFKRLRRLTVIFNYFRKSKESIELFSFKVFKGFENITHLSIRFYGIPDPLSETILTDIDINLPKLQYFAFWNKLVVTEWCVHILRRLSKLKKIHLNNTSGNVNDLEYEFNKDVNQFK